jgi:Tfp pilus assembly protein PilV
MQAPQKKPGALITNKSEQGFTLIETAIAMIVMMVAGLGAVALFTYAIRVNNISGGRAAAISIAQQKLEQFRGVTFDNTVLAPGVATETVSGVDSSYTVQTTVCAASTCGGSDTLKNIEIVVTPVRSDGLGAGMAVVVRTQRAAPTAGPYLQ